MASTLAGSSRIQAARNQSTSIEEWGRPVQVGGGIRVIWSKAAAAGARVIIKRRFRVIVRFGRIGATTDAARVLQVHIVGWQVVERPAIGATRMECLTEAGGLIGRGIKIWSRAIEAANE
eukprot:4298011-Prymnesium_polylepis.2